VECYERRESAKRPATSARAESATATPKPGELDDVVGDAEVVVAPVGVDVAPPEVAVDVVLLVGVCAGWTVTFGESSVSACDEGAPTIVSVVPFVVSR